MKPNKQMPNTKRTRGAQRLNYKLKGFGVEILSLILAQKVNERVLIRLRKNYIIIKMTAKAGYSSKLEAKSCLLKRSGSTEWRSGPPQTPTLNLEFPQHRVNATRPKPN